MSKIVILCEDYGNIPSALYVATRNCHDYPVTLVVPGHRDLYKFFQVINERVFHNTINLIYFEPYQAGRVTAKGIKKALYVLPDIIKERRHLKEVFNKYFAGLEGCEVFFFSRGFSGFAFYLLKKLGKRNRWVYMPHSSPDMPYSMMCQYTPTNIVYLARLIILKLIYGPGIALGQYPSESPYTKGFAYIPDKVMREEVDRVIDLAEKKEMMKNFDLNQFRVFGVGCYRVIYFDDGLIEAFRFADWNTYQRDLTEIFGILAKYFPEKEIARKYHPGYSGDKTAIKIGDVLPDFIPAEFLYNDNTKMYLSLFSSSIANVEKGLAVSIADLITFKDEKIRKQLKEVITGRSRSEILFPKSLDEFEKILAGTKQQLTCD